MPPDHPDQTRVLALLWRRPDAPSGRAGLHVGRIADAAIAIADAEGLAAVSMRRIAERLGVGAMSLYTYVPGKSELVFVMVDTVLGEMPLTAAGHGAWRAALAEVGRAWWQLFRRHGWLLDVAETRPIMGPHGMERFERDLRAIDGIGLDDRQMNAAVALVRNHAAGTARTVRDIARDAERSGVDHDQWWQQVAPVLSTLIGGRQYPVANRVGTTIAAPHGDPEHDLEFGLARIIDGIALLVDA